MEITSIFNDVKLITPKKHDDLRGFFSEIYNNKDFKNLDIKTDFVQDNLSFSVNSNTIRGMHFQKEPFSQAKLVKVLKGSIFDVFIDLRDNSEFYENYGTYNLNENDGWLFVPKGYAHGFCTTEPDTLVLYKVDNHYNAKLDSGLIWNDPFFDIPWPKNSEEIIISDKDSRLPNWNQVKDNNIFGENK